MANQNLPPESTPRRIVVAIARRVRVCHASDKSLAAVRALARVDRYAGLAGVADLRVAVTDCGRHDASDDRRDERNAEQQDEREHGIARRLIEQIRHGRFSLLLTGATILALAALTGCSSIRPLVIATHVSDPSDSGQSDTTVDFLGAGITAGRAGFSIDAALGRKAINCAPFKDCPSTLGAVATIRWSPLSLEAR